MLIAIGFADFPTQLHTAWHRIVLRNHASETDGKILGKTWHINWAKFGQNRTNLWHKKFPCIFSAWERKKGDEIRRRYFIIIQSLFCIYSIYKIRAFTTDTWKAGWGKIWCKYWAKFGQFMCHRLPIFFPSDFLPVLNGVKIEQTAINEIN